jgi:hypothetical protein
VDLLAERPDRLAVLPLAATQLRESHGPDRSLDIPGLALVSSGLFGIVWGLVRGNSLGWTIPRSWSRSAPAPCWWRPSWPGSFVRSAPMLPMRFFRRRAFAASNAASLLMYFGMFGSIFLLTQYLQLVHGYSPLRAGVATLPWTAMPMLIAPDRRRVRRPHRRTAADGDRDGAAGGRAGMDGGASAARARRTSRW